MDLKVKVPKTLPEYVSAADVEMLLRGTREQKTHKNLAQRDGLMVQELIGHASLNS